MKISIVVPARNEEKFIAGTLRSLKNQTYRGEYEIVVVDNCSTDKTADIAREMGCRVVQAYKEKSVFYARQAGVEAVDGDIIVQADGDTLYPEKWLGKIAARFEKDPKAVAVAGRFLYREKFIWSFVELTVRDFLNKVSMFFSGRPLLVSGATFAFRREAFFRVGGYKDLTYSADQHGISTRLREIGKIIYDNKIVVLTSARSVRKPMMILFMNVIANLARLLLDFGLNLAKPHHRKIPFSLIKRLAVGFAVMMAFFIAFAAYGYFVPSSPVFGRVYYKGDSGLKEVALTFDDGPNGTYTTQILDILDKYNIDATFFVLGQNVELYPDIAKRIVADGSVLGNHSNTHDANHALTAQGEKDLVAAENIIYSVTGVKPHLYRPPHGKKTPWELDCVKANDLIEITWNVAVNDQVSTDNLAKAAREFADKIIARVGSGSIILLHDGYGTSHDIDKSDKTFTVLALPLIIEQLQAKGYRFVTVPELLDVPAYIEAD